MSIFFTFKGAVLVAEFFSHSIAFYFFKYLHARWHSLLPGPQEPGPLGPASPQGVGRTLRERMERGL